MTGPPHTTTSGVNGLHHHHQGAMDQQPPQGGWCPSFDPPGQASRAFSAASYHHGSPGPFGRCLGRTRTSGIMGEGGGHSPSARVVGGSSSSSDSSSSSSSVGSDQGAGGHDLELSMPQGAAAGGAEMPQTSALAAVPMVSVMTSPRGSAASQISARANHLQQQRQQQWSPPQQQQQGGHAMGEAWARGPPMTSDGGARTGGLWQAMPAPGPGPAPPTMALTAFQMQLQQQQHEQQEEAEAAQAPRRARRKQRAAAGPQREGGPVPATEAGTEAAQGTWWASLPPEELLRRRIGPQLPPRPTAALAAASSSSSPSTMSVATTSTAISSLAPQLWPPAAGGEEGEQGLDSPAWQEALIDALERPAASCPEQPLPVEEGAGAGGSDGASAVGHGVGGGGLQLAGAEQHPRVEGRAVGAFVAAPQPAAAAAGPSVARAGPPPPPPMARPPAPVPYRNHPYYNHYHHHQQQQQQHAPPPPQQQQQARSAMDMGGPWGEPAIGAAAGGCGPGLVRSAIPGAGAMLEVVTDMQHSLLMMSGQQLPAKRARTTRSDLRHLSLEQKLERRRANARVYSQQARERREQEFQMYREHTTVLAMFQYLVQESPDPLALLHPMDTFGRIIYANNAFLRLLGHPPEELINTRIMSLIHPDDRVSVTQRLHALFLVPMQPPSPSAVARWEQQQQQQQQQGGGVPSGLALLEQLPLPAPHPSATIRIRVARRHPAGWVTARLRMRRGREGIICSFAMMEGAGAGEAPPQGGQRAQGRNSF